MKSWQLLAFGILLGLLSAAVILLVIRQPSGRPIEILPAPSPMPLVVDVSGQVLSPGVYSLPPGARVSEAIAAAGGLLDDADPSMINLAARVKDGDKVWIPAEGSLSSIPLPESSRSSSVTTINLNTASAKELETLPGIGEVKANEIVAYREEHGLYLSIDDLLNVPGIGPELLEKIRPSISLSD